MGRHFRTRHTSEANRVQIRSRPRVKPAKADYWTLLRRWQFYAATAQALVAVFLFLNLVNWVFGLDMSGWAIVSPSIGGVIGSQALAVAQRRVQDSSRQMTVSPTTA